MIDRQTNYAALISTIISISTMHLIIKSPNSSHGKVEADEEPQQQGAEADEEPQQKVVGLLLPHHGK